MTVTDPQAVDARRRKAVARTLAAVGGVTLLPPAAPAPADANAALTAPQRSGGIALAQALARRRSVRSFTAASLALAAVSQLLWAAQGTSGASGRRTTPSAGALYPLELHLVAMRVDGLAVGVHRYLPAKHGLRFASSEATAAALQQAALDQAAVGTAAAVLAISAVEARSAAKYGARAARYVALEAGAAAQNFALQAVALGLGSVVIGAFDDAAVARVLHLPAGEAPMVLMPVGAPA